MSHWTTTAAHCRTAPIVGEITYIKEEAWPYKKDQFSIIHKYTQTEIFWPRNVGCLCESPKCVTFGGQADQSVIFEAYEQDLIGKRNRTESASSKFRTIKSTNHNTESSDSINIQTSLSDFAETQCDVVQSENDSSETTNMFGIATEGGVVLREEILRQMGRTLNQNNLGDVAQDFKYWNDPADKHKSEGSFCPLWVYDCDKEQNGDEVPFVAKKEPLQVTSITMSVAYNDYFAVGLGSLNFGHSTRGKAVVYSFKNVLEPEYECSTESGVLRVRFCHLKSHSHLLAFSCYDGVVAICNLARKTNIMTNYMTIGRHIGPVWDLTWNTTNNIQVEDPNIISAGSDGRVVLWNLTAFGKLSYTDIVQLQRVHSMSAAELTPNGEDPDFSGGLLPGLGRGVQEALYDRATAIEFRPSDEKGVARQSVGVFLVATEEGWVHVCNSRHRNKVSSSKWRAHMATVEKISFNLFNSDVLLTIGGDWSLKTWKLNVVLNSSCAAEPCIHIDFPTHVLDAVWTSYSSTSFTAVSHDRHLLFYNLAESRTSPVKTQPVVGRKTHTTAVLLSKHDPIVFVGDSRGEVSVLKLSPNLRKQWVCNNIQKKKSAADKEREKANLENEKSVQEAKFEGERNLLLKVLGYEEPHSVYEADTPPRDTKQHSSGHCGQKPVQQRPKSSLPKSFHVKRRSTSLKSRRATSISKRGFSIFAEAMVKE